MFFNFFFAARGFSLFETVDGVIYVFKKWYSHVVNNIHARELTMYNDKKRKNDEKIIPVISVFHNA